MSRKAHLAATVLVPLWRGRRLLRSLHPSSRERGQRVLAYHAIGAAIPDDRLGLHSITPARFREQMELLARSGLRVGALGDLDTDVAITFDDGYRDTLTEALPILDRFGFELTVFVATGFARGADALYLRAADLKTLERSGHAAVGAHGASHERLTDLDDGRLEAELTQSKTWLEDVLGHAITTMSYPHGAVDPRVRAAVRAAGFLHAWTSQFGVNTLPSTNEAPLMLRRIAVWSTDDAHAFEEKLRGDWDWMGHYKAPA